jgi:hypothetical protein
MRRRETDGLHLLEPHRTSSTEELPSGLTTGKPAADYGDRGVMIGHPSIPEAVQTGFDVESSEDVFDGVLCFMILLHWV